MEKALGKIVIPENMDITFMDKHKILYKYRI